MEQMHHRKSMRGRFFSGNFQTEGI